MATILFAWELGRGLGHMMRMRPLAEGLARGGHRVFVTVRNVAGATAVFGRSGVHYLGAPCRFGGRPYARLTLSMAHVLANVGWARSDELFGLACAWRNLFLMVRPDLVVFDHSPTALLASRALPGVKRVMLGHGFFCPPDGDPSPLFPNYRPSDEGRRRELEARLRADEALLLRNANAMLADWKQPPLERLGQLFCDVDETFLTTFPELDHYGAREGVRYWGPDRPAPGGKPFTWPEASRGGSDKRVYAYLKDSPLVSDVLAALNRRGHSTVVYSDGVDEDVRRKFKSETLRFEDERLDLAQVGGECDLAIHNGNAGTAAELLLAGRPALQVPLAVEHVLTAAAVERLGAAQTVTPALTSAEPGALELMLDALLADGRYAHAARQFARKYESFDWQARRREMLDRVEQLLSALPRRRPVAAAAPGAARAGAAPVRGPAEVSAPLPSPNSVASPEPTVVGLFGG